jgi:hypothetical protein
MDRLLCMPYSSGYIAIYTFTVTIFVATYCNWLPLPCPCDDKEMPQHVATRSSEDIDGGRADDGTSLVSCKVAPMVLACIEQKPEQLGVGVGDEL